MCSDRGFKFERVVLDQRRLTSTIIRGTIAISINIMFVISDAQDGRRIICGGALTRP